MKSYKLYIPNTVTMSREAWHNLIQPHAFKLGYRWAYKNNVKCVDASFLILLEDGTILYGETKGVNSFFDSPAIEVTPQEFLALR